MKKKRFFPIYMSAIISIFTIFLSSHQKTEMSIVKILFVGDTNFGENYQVRRGRRNILETKGYDYPVQNFKPLLLQSDLVIANLETPITNLSKPPFPDKEFVHWTDIENAPHYLKKYNITTVSLANNHALDYGVEGMKQTLDVLQSNDMEWVGAGRDEVEAGKPYLRKMQIGKQFFHLALIAGFEYRKNYDNKYAFYAKADRGGVNALSIEKISAQIKQLKKSIPDVFVVIFPHWGANYKWKSKKQTRQGRQMIDAGADLIIGHGSHLMQEIEQYNGRWIIYSVGNFMFNSPGRYQKHHVHPYSLVAQLVLQENDGRLIKMLRLYPIFTDNRVTNYQGRFVTSEEFEEAYQLLLDRNSSRRFKQNFRKGQDGIGRFFKVSIN